MQLIGGLDTWPACDQLIWRAELPTISPDLMFWFALATKMAITALFVTVATIIAEKLGAVVGALVATLPVSAGPVYLFLALDHDPTFISASAVASLAMNAATAVFVTAYVRMAQRRSLWISVSLAFIAWLATTLVLSSVRWTALSASVVNLSVFALCLWIVKPFPKSYRGRVVGGIGTRRKGWHGDTARGRRRHSEFSNWSRRKRRACCIPGHLRVYHGDLASPRWRSRYGRSASERRSRACRFRRSAANSAPFSSVVWISPGPSCRSRCLRCLECRFIFPL